MTASVENARDTAHTVDTTGSTDTGGSTDTAESVSGHSTCHARPSFDVTAVLRTALLVVGAVLIANRLASRPPGARADVTMGPGGWVSLKGGAVAVRPSARLWRRSPAGSDSARPLWARLLRAQRLEAFLARR